MANRLKNIVAFVGVPIGVPTALPHGLNANGIPVVPDNVEVDDGDFVVLSADAINVTVRNDGIGLASVNVIVEHWHTIERTFGNTNVLSLTPQPFLPKSGPETTQTEIFTAAAQDQVYIEPLVPGLTASAHGIRILPPIVSGRLVRLSVWSALPADTDTMLVRLFRYRRLTAVSPFSITQITSDFTYTSVNVFSFELDISANIIPFIELALNDQIAVSRLYTAGGSPGMVNFLIKWAVAPFDVPPVSPLVADPPLWPAP